MRHGVARETHHQTGRERLKGAHMQTINTRLLNRHNYQCAHRNSTSVLKIVDLVKWVYFLQSQQKLNKEINVQTEG